MQQVEADLGLNASGNTDDIEREYLAAHPEAAAAAAAPSSLMPSFMQQMFGGSSSSHPSNEVESEVSRCLT